MKKVTIIFGFFFSLVFSGWTFYSQKNEYERLGVTKPNSKWRITECNLKFEVCSSYPEYLVVPKECTDSQLLGAAKFRVFFSFCFFIFSKGKIRSQHPV
jgi:hypothetical protein